MIRHPVVIPVPFPLSRHTGTSCELNIDWILPTARRVLRAGRTPPRPPGFSGGNLDGFGQAAGVRLPEKRCP
jgi:hypothetical protein